MRRGLLLAAAVLLASACRSRREAPASAQPQEDASYGKTLEQYAAPPVKGEAAAPKEGSWSAKMEEALGSGLVMPGAPLAYAYHAGGDPQYLAENIGNAAKFIAYSLRYQKEAGKIPARFWTDRDKAAFEQNRVSVEKARRILKDDAARLTR